MEPFAKLFNNLVTNGFEFFGRYYSSYRGFVVDNKDPENLGRVKLIIPQLTGSDVINYWAWSKGCFSGDGYGIQITPQINEMVWVEFEQGSPRKPIWHFGHFAKSIDDATYDKPQSLIDIKNFWFKSPGKHLIEADDTNEWIKVTSSKGGELQLDDKFKILAGSSPAVLGDKNSQLLTEVHDVLSDISNLLQNIATADTDPVATIAAVTGGTLTYTSQITTALPPIIQKIADIQTKISNNNSSKVTLE